jgi:hypothetical protein
MLRNIAAQSSTWSDELVLDALQCVSKHEAVFAALGSICSTPGTETRNRLLGHFAATDPRVGTFREG